MNQDDARYARYTGEHGFDNRYMTPEELKTKLQKFPSIIPRPPSAGASLSMPRGAISISMPKTTIP
jgi:hypothetical protein